MLPVIYTSFFVFGAIVASFMGVVAGRLYTGQSFLYGRSRCDVCSTPLAFYTLVPVFSYIVLRGRAYCCGSRVSLLAPFSEILLGTLFMLAYHTLGFTPTLLFFLIALSSMLALVLYDLTHQILPSPLLIVFVSASAVAGFLSAGSFATFQTTLLYAAVLASTLAALHFFSRGRAMGLADTPFVLGLALLTGSAALSGFIFSFWIGAVIGIVLLARRPRGSRMGVEVPFAPFLAAGFLLAYFTQWNPFTLIAFLLGN